MGLWNGHALLLATWLIGACSAFEWQSASVVPDKMSMPACEGENVEFPWGYTKQDAEVVLNVEWHYQPNEGNADEMLATEVNGRLFLDPTATKDVEYIPNAGIRVKNVSKGDSGRYSVHVNINLHGSIKIEEQSVNLVVASDPLVNGQLEAKFNGARLVNETGEEHIVLSCGRINPLWARSINVKWTTPSNETLDSTYDNNGTFLLTVPNPVQEGEYTCFIDDHPSAKLCVHSDSAVRMNASVSIDALDSRLLLMESKINELKTEQGHKDDLINVLTEQLGNLTDQILDFQNSKSQMTTEIQKLGDVNANLSRTLGDLESMKRDIEHLNTANAQLSQQVGEIQSLRGDVQALMAANENLTQQMAEITTLKSEIQSVREENANLRQQCGQCLSLETELQTVENETVTLTDKLRTAAQSVSFHALSDDRVYSPGTKVVFPNVLNNDGDAYENSTGVFTAPVTGTYTFHVSVQITTSSPNSKDVWADLVMNDDPIIKIPTSYTNNTHVQGSGQAVVVLQAGDKMWVNNMYGGAKFYDVATAFSGALLHASMA